ncbi:hypothetical protein [Imtechella halotolerans]|uniref:Adhesin domain-containing protein n=1 Tax=Imtechella halotolerans K1 TaxID=946077 RepID=I0WE54_9FLAO|nr:hypothetical protein [Imtechella halotolerans]EID74670.1 hypothetical protein W5A_07817 [Imtechella halotolerans K1]WMQ64209.1 hypothetical protein PT603_04345 [Imtechella halotolerans]
MKTYYKIALILLVLPLSLLANGKMNGKYTKEKTIKKEFTVNKDALLKINNKYGNLHITSWDQSRTVIEVHITTNGNDESKVTQRLSEIDVLFEHNPSMVSASTNIKESNWKWGWKNNNVNMEINYIIKVPVTNRADLKNNYGSIQLNKLNNTATIICNYGRLDIGELWGDHNVLNFDYTSRSVIGFMKNGKINADYSGFILEKAGKIDLNADYTNAKIDRIDYLSFNTDYGNLTVDDVDYISGNFDYLTLRLGKINQFAKLEASYGSIKIDEVTKATNSVAINSRYTSIQLGYQPQWSFKFNINLKYAGLKGDEELDIQKKNTTNTSKYCEGEHLSGSATLSIDSEYGGVTLRKL